MGEGVGDGEGAWWGSWVGSWIIRHGPWVTGDLGSIAGWEGGVSCKGDHLEQLAGRQEKEGRGGGSGGRQDGAAGVKFNGEVGRGQ